MSGMPGNYKSLNPTVSGQSVYAESTTPKADLGAVVNIGDKSYKYSVAGTALAAGDLLTCAANTQVANATAGAAAVAGATGVTVYGADAINAGVFNEGELCVNDLTGAGYSYRIKSQPAVSSAGTAVVTLYDPLKTALGVLSLVSLVTNQNRLTNVTSATTPIKGVAVCAVTSGNYFFAQTEGPTMAAVRAAVVYGNILIPTATAGKAEVIDVTDNAHVIGVAIASGSAGAFAPIMLRLQ